MTDLEERLKVAQELCRKDGLTDGRTWETIDQGMRNAYLHNADTEISRVEEKVEAKKIEESGVPVCDLCKGAMYVSGEPCRECNPVGLPAPDKPEPSEHKHSYRKDGTCVCGAVLSASRMKKRALKAKG